MADAAARPTVTLRPVDPTLAPAVAALRVRPDQEDLVAPNARSLAEAELGWPASEGIASTVLEAHAIIEADRPVGLLLTAIDRGAGRALVLRFMVDATEQGRGVGRAALAALVARLARDPAVRELVVTCRPDNAVARRLYATAGFEPLGEDVDEVRFGRRLPAAPGLSGRAG